MRFIIKNIYRLLIENWKYSLLILFDLVICTTVVFILLQNYFYLKARHDITFYGGEPATIYSVSVEEENMIEALSEGTNRTPYYHNALDMIEEMNSKDLHFFTFEYVPVMPNELSTVSKLDFEDYAHDVSVGSDDMYENYISFINVSEHAFEGLALQVDEGRAFEKEDFYNTDNSKPLAAVLGSNYKDDLKLGDHITYDCGNGKEEMIVVGFLESGSNINIYEESAESLDDYILIPSNAMGFPRNSEVKTEDDVKGQMYGNLVFQSFVSCYDTDVDVQKEVNKITSKYGFYKLETTPINGCANSEAKSVSEKNIKIMLALAVIMTVSCMLSLGGILYSKARKDRAANCVFLCCGIPLYKINLSVILEMVFLAVVSVMPCVAISLREFGDVYIPYWHMGVYIVFVALVSLIPVFVINGKCNLDLMIRNQIK